MSCTINDACTGTNYVKPFCDTQQAVGYNPGTVPVKENLFLTADEMNGWFAAVVSALNKGSYVSTYSSPSIRTSDAKGSLANTENITADDVNALIGLLGEINISISSVEKGELITAAKFKSIYDGLSNMKYASDACDTCNSCISCEKCLSCLSCQGCYTCQSCNTCQGYSPSVSVN